MSHRDEEGRPPFDIARARAMVGKSVLLGITYFDHEGSMMERKQLYGVVVSADARQGFVVELEGPHTGETFSLPPDLRAFQAAPAGEYRLKSAPELVRDPDFLCMFSITKAAPPSSGRPA